MPPSFDGVAAGLLTWLLRFKTLVLVLFLAPLIIGSTFRNVAGMPELIGFCSTSLLYGVPGILAGMLYADYQRTKAYFVKVSKTSFNARGGIGLSSVYLLGYFGQKIIFDNPMVEFALCYIKGRDRAKEIAEQVDYDGALTAGGVIAFTTYRERRSINQRETLPATSKQETNTPSCTTPKSFLRRCLPSCFVLPDTICGPTSKNSKSFKLRKTCRLSS